MTHKGAGGYAGSDDERLVVLIREGDAEATRALAERYVNVAKEIARQYTGSPGEWGWFLVRAIDRCVVQGRFDPAIGPLRPYLTKSIRNEARSFNRSERRYRQRQESLDQLVEAGSAVEALLLGVAPPDELAAVEQRCIVDSLLEEWEGAASWRLQKRRWAFILRRTIDGHRPDEIALALGVEAKSVHNALVRHIRPRLRQALERGYAEPWA
jgi:DNA-directed RNA polymerase specialized sigma24 family protein